MKWVYLLIAILTEVVATGALKASHSFTRLGPSLLTVAGLPRRVLLSEPDAPRDAGWALRMRSGAAWVSCSCRWPPRCCSGRGSIWGAIVGMALIIAGVIVINVFSKTVENH